VNDLDEKLSKILASFEIQTAKEGELLSCSHCAGDTPHTFKGLCGPCFLWGDRLVDPCSPRFGIVRKKAN